MSNQKISMRFLTVSRKILIAACAMPLFIQCDSCDGESPKARVESNSSSRTNRVRVTFNHQDSGQSFQVVDVTEDSPKITAPLPAGRYSIHADVTRSTGTQTVRLNAQLDDCTDYTVFVNVFSVSMNVNGTPR